MPGSTGKELHILECFSIFCIKTNGFCFLLNMNILELLSIIIKQRNQLAQERMLERLEEFMEK